MNKGQNWWLLVVRRHRATFSSFRQWKDLLVFKRHNGHSVWNLPKFKATQFGFDHIAKKPPFFKSRKYAPPPIVTHYNVSQDVLYNRDVCLRYNWTKDAAVANDIVQIIATNFPGLRVNRLVTHDKCDIVILNSNGHELLQVDGTIPIKGEVFCRALVKALEAS